MASDFTGETSVSRLEDLLISSLWGGLKQCVQIHICFQTKIERLLVEQSFGQ